MRCDHIQESRGDVGDRLVPRSRFEPAFALGADPAHRGEQSFWMVRAFKVAIDLRTKESLRDWMVM
jgi:hypothetical protein